jgi:type IV pilus assembly protein PilA
MLTSVVKRLHEKRTAKLEGEAESGFTLIELMVVLLIMAILLAIAIPTFLGVKGGAQDRAAQSNLNTALTNAKAVYGNNQTYGTTDASVVSSLQQSEASLKFVTGSSASASQNQISVAVNVSSTPTDNPGNGLILVAKSASGTCWGIMTNEVATLSGTVGTSGPAWPTTTNGSSTQAGTFYAAWSSSSAICSAAKMVGATTKWTGWVQNKFPSAK